MTQEPMLDKPNSERYALVMMALEPALKALTTHLDALRHQFGAHYKLEQWDTSDSRTYRVVMTIRVMR